MIHLTAHGFGNGEESVIHVSYRQLPISLHVMDNVEMIAFFSTNQMRAKRRLEKQSSEQTSQACL